ncbi:MAG: IPT/TIG domain-containing protein [Acidobacteriota bacterium]|nr:IPT/TIG domain-containing protein [Acidobacteriota bacterium]
MVNAKSGRVKGGYAVVNGATWSSGPVASREIITIYGSGFDTSATVQFDEVPAQVLFAGPDQINAIVPDSITGRSTTALRVMSKGGVALEQVLPVADVSPGLFTIESTGRDQAAALNQTNRVNTPADPAARGSVVALFGTGGGSYSGVSVAIGGEDARVMYAGNAPEAVNGLMQVNAVIPDSVASGSVSVVLTINGAVSRPDTVLSVQE